MLHPDADLRHVSDDIGLGVFATRPIPRGTLVWVVCDRERIYTPEEAAALSPADQEAVEHHGYIDARGHYVLCCDLGRYMNHACAPTTLPLGMEVEIAIRDVAVGEQLTCEYGTLNLTSALPCRCRLRSCRRVIRGDDVLRYWPEWDRLIQYAVACAAAVPQPLLPFAMDRENLEAIIGKAMAVPSVLACFNPETEGLAMPEAEQATPLWRLPEPRRAH